MWHDTPCCSCRSLVCLASFCTIRFLLSFITRHASDASWVFCDAVATVHIKQKKKAIRWPEFRRLLYCSAGLSRHLKDYSSVISHNCHDQYAMVLRDAWFILLPGILNYHDRHKQASVPAQGEASTLLIHTQTVTHQLRRLNQHHFIVRTADSLETLTRHTS